MTRGAAPVTGAARHERIVATAADAGQRLDRFLSLQLPDLSRTHIQRLIRDGHVQVSPGRIKAGLEVTSGLTIDVDIPAPEPLSLLPEALPLTVLYEDQDIVAIGKPAGVVVHPSAGHRSGTVVNALLHHVQDLSGIGGVERPGIVHRLDRGTSGVLLVAKSDRAHRSLTQQFRDRLVQKTYVALVWGKIGAGTTIDRPIGRDPRHRKKMSSRAPRGREALTRVLSCEPLGGVSFVTLTIVTGRTHQIRVHLSEAGHPVVGDTLYGGERRRVPPALAPVLTLTRPFLHALRLTFVRPSDGSPLTVEAPLPEDLTSVRRHIETEVSMKTPRAPRRLGRRTVYRGRVFRIEADRVRLSNGRTVTMDVVRHRGSVVLIPMPAEDRVILIRQYRVRDSTLDLGVACRFAGSGRASAPCGTTRMRGRDRTDAGPDPSARSVLSDARFLRRADDLLPLRATDAAETQGRTRS